MELNKEEQEAIERINYIQDFIIENGQFNADVEEIQHFSKVLNLIEKQSKVIDEMADKLSEYTCWNKDNLDMNKLASIEEIKQYFYRKAENNENN